MGAKVTEHLFIAEKPSLAEAVAKARAVQKGVAASKQRGYWEVGDDKVCWLFGHMYEQFAPPDYDGRFKQWNLDHLPIVPETWRLKVVEDKKDHISGIATLLKGAKNVVNAGDAAREGQLLVDEVLIENGWDPFSDKTLRLWVSSVAQKDLIKALEGMQGNKTKQHLYEAAVCRSRADWLHGMNMTRLYSIKARHAGSDQMVSVGRVQTPTLALVVNRDLEIKNFKPVDHYLPMGRFVHENGKFTANYIIPEDCPGLDPEGRLTDKAVAEEINERISGKTGKIEIYAASDKSKAPPLPYSLSALQTDCSAKFGLSAQETLDVAQGLYEKHKLTTYPRSDSRYLPMSILKDEAPGILESLSQDEGKIGAAARNATPAIKSAAWNDAKVSDHHGIIPTSEVTARKIAGLSGVEAQVFELIAKTFVAQFYPDQRWKSLSATVRVGDDKFKASGRRDIDAGWRKVFTGDHSEEPEEVEEDAGQTLPEMKKDDAVSVEGGDVQSKRTTPPAHFTDGTLIAAMTQVHKFVTDPETKKRLKENDGLGTEATRANMIETLIKRGFLMRKGKNKLLSTLTGQSVVGVLPDEITDPGLTAIWEGALDRVAKGDLDHEAFMEAQVKSLNKRIENGKTANVTIKGAKTIKPLEGHGKECPKCAEGQMVTKQIRTGKHKGKTFLSCTRYPTCESVEWPQPKIDPLPGHGDDCPTCKEGKMVTRQINKAGPSKGKKFLSCNRYPECKAVKWPEPDIKPIEGHGQPCKKCNEGKMKTREIMKAGPSKGKKFLSCDRYPGCDAVIWPEDNVKPMEGHGKDCPTCGKGKMKTRKSAKGVIFMSCTAYPECKHSEFPPDKIDPISGHGEGCTKCGKGKMITKLIRKGDKKGQKFLSCDAYPGCDNTVWPK